jgi:hypothetical protein
VQIAVPAVIAAAKAAGVDRVLVLSALGVGDAFANTRYVAARCCQPAWEQGSEH